MRSVGWKHAFNFWTRRNCEVFHGVSESILMVLAHQTPTIFGSCLNPVPNRSKHIYNLLSKNSSCIQTLKNIDTLHLIGGEQLRREKLPPRLANRFSQVRNPSRGNLDRAVCPVAVLVPKRDHDETIAAWVGGPAQDRKKDGGLAVSHASLSVVPQSH